MTYMYIHCINSLLTVNFLNNYLAKEGEVKTIGCTVVYANIAAVSIFFTFAKWGASTMYNDMLSIAIEVMHCDVTNEMHLFISR